MPSIDEVLKPEPVTVALCVIGTGKYRDFIPELVRSARRYFLPDCHVSYVAFSDQMPIPNLMHLWVRVPFTPWPGPTLFRYHWFLEIEKELGQSDYVFYADADAKFVDTVDRSILSELVAVQHQAFMCPDRPPWQHEDNPDSAAYVSGEQRTLYCAGGFQGGRTGAYLDASRAMRAWIDRDQAKGTCPRWHDESYWNRYLIDNPPTLILPGTWACDEVDRWPGARLIWLRKDHATIRQ